jgi:hypothetical protein
MDFHYNQVFVMIDNDGYYPEFPRYLDNNQIHILQEKKSLVLPFLEQSSSSRLTNCPISGKIY